MKVPYNDLSRIHEPLRETFHSILDDVITTSSFIGTSDTFVETFKKYTGSDFCVPCNSGTDALYIAIKSLNLPDKSKIAVPAMTFAATAMAVVNAGHEPVFIDVDEYTGLMDVTKVERGKYACVIPVHLYGQCADVYGLMHLGIPIIEDCAQAHGCKIDGKHVGTIGTIGCFSFYPGKNLGALGDGGAAITNDPRLADAMTQYTKLGASLTNRYNHEIIGIKSTIDCVQSLFLNEKIKHIDSWNEQRRTIGKYYEEKIPNPVKRSTIGTDVYHVFYTLQDNRDEYIRYMNERGVQTNIQYPFMLPDLPCFTYTECPNAKEFSRRCVSIPLFPMMTQDEIEFTLNCHIDYCRLQDT